MQIRQINFQPKAPKLKRVCAYARVSSGKDAMLHSLAAQVEYYSNMIRHTAGWEYAGVYYDEAKTGTKDSRENFQRMLEDARDGKLDLIITKSVSRFARNTLTLLDTVRELKSLNCDVFFEEQNIHTMSDEGELMLTLLASFAQEESRSVSENMKWRIRNNFKEGIPWDKTLFGYRFRDGQYVIEEKEANTVRFIFDSFLSGKGTGSIADELNDMGITTRFGNRWSNSTVMRLLKNITYTGSLLLQKTYSENHLTKKKIINSGQLPRYMVADSHESIISRELFDAVQKEFEKRQNQYGCHETRPTYALTGKIVCGVCGNNYKRKKRRDHFTWLCTTYNSKGKSACDSKQVPEDVILKFTYIYGIKTIDHITVADGNRLIFALKDGSTFSHHWEHKSRKDSWTDEMRLKASEDGKRGVERKRSKTCKQEKTSQ